MQPLKAARLAVLCLALVGVLCGSRAAEPEPYYCIEDYIPIGQLIRNVAISGISDKTSGELARQCGAACDAEPTCTAFRAVGTEAVSGTSCALLANTTASLPQDLTLPPGGDWPHVLSNLSAADYIQLRSVAWLCIKSAAAWDAFGEATHALIHTGVAVPNPGTQQQWCAFGTDVAGTNLQLYTNIERPLQCEWMCGNTTGCTIWTFVAAKPDTGQAPRNCFVKADPFTGQNGWTGPPKPDIWIPDSQGDCFVNELDFRQLGLILSPAIKTISLNNSYYTVYPERVTWTEANATCGKLPNGRLAILDSRIDLDTVYRQLLTTLPSQTAVTSAWVGAAGVNTQYNPAAPNHTSLAAQPGGVSQSQLAQLGSQLPTVKANNLNLPGPETTLKWLNGDQVSQDQLRRLQGLPSVWTVHDVIWSIQYVPESAQQVCGRLLIQTPPTNPQGYVNATQFDPSAYLPGVWFFDCGKPAGFICESSSPPTGAMTGRTVVEIGGGPPPPPAPAGSSSNWRVALAVVIPTVCVSLVVWQLSRMYAHKSRLPALIWQQRKRALGPPRSGRMSIVVTDIQGYTQLTNEAPDDMAQALLLHNQVIKHAVYDQVGYVIEQEGDSFTISFYEPEDAVAFTLQVQQALLEQSWPPSMHYHDAWDSPHTSALEGDPSQHSPSAAAADAAAGQRHSVDDGSHSPTNKNPNAPGLGLRPSLEMGLTWLRSLGPAAAAPDAASQVGSAAISGPGPVTEAALPVDHTLVTSIQQQEQQQHTSWLPNFLMSPSRHKRRSSNGSQHSMHSVAPSGPSAGRMSSFQPPSPSAASAAGRSLNSTAWLNRIHPSFWARSSQSTSGFSFVAPHPHAVHTAHGTAHTGSILPHWPGRRKNGSWLHQLLVPGPQQPQLFHGLRVRMGVATGVVTKGQDVKRSPLYTTAQDVSTAANGGQVLMDEPTFISVKEGMRRLGLITAAGLDYDLLYASGRHSNGSKAGSARLPGMGSGGLSLSGVGRGGGSSRTSGGSRMQRLLSGCVTPSERDSEAGRGSRTADGQQHAVALDMGCYEVVPGAGGSASAASAAAAAASGSTYILWTGEMGGKLVQQYQQYLQQQLHTPERDGHFNFHGQPFSLANGSAYDLEQPPSSTYGSYTGSAFSPEDHQQYGDGQYGDRQYGKRVSRRHGRQHTSGQPQTLRGASNAGLSLRQQLRAMQRERLGFSGRGDHSVGLGGKVEWVQKPRGWWQQLTRSVLGIGVIEQGSAGGADSPLEALSWQSSTAAIAAPSSHPAAGSSGSWSINALHLTPPSIRLYQIVSPSLIGRAALFGSKLSLPSSWRCLDAPYFAAPGLNVTDGGSSSSSMMRLGSAAVSNPEMQGGSSAADAGGWSGSAASLAGGSVASSAINSIASSAPLRSYQPQQLRSKSKSKGNLPVVKSGQSLAAMAPADEPEGLVQPFHELPAGTGAAERPAAGVPAAAPAGAGVAAAAGTATAGPEVALHQLQGPASAAPLPPTGQISASAAVAAPGLALAAAGAVAADLNGSLHQLQMQPYLPRVSPFAAAASMNAAGDAAYHGLPAIASNAAPASAAAAPPAVGGLDHQQQLVHAAVGSRPAEHWLPAALQPPAAQHAQHAQHATSLSGSSDPSSQISLANGISGVAASSDDNGSNVGSHGGAGSAVPALAAAAAAAAAARAPAGAPVHVPAAGSYGTADLSIPVVAADLTAASNNMANDMQLNGATLAAAPAPGGASNQLQQAAAAPAAAAPAAAAPAAAAPATAAAAQAAAVAAAAPGGSSGRSRSISPARQGSALLPASSIASHMAMLSLTGAASPPGVGGGGCGPDDRASGRGGVPRSPGLKFPQVTIVFASVEGGSQLARQPVLAKTVHASVHHLMLQLLRKFPGSYLIRAQAGELKYLAAFTTPTAAVSWCLTVQEAALYLPYPAELLGFSSFGVQLDVRGRLVFRGPRFKMGLNEGTPTCILPDHLGRADYHGAFVNQAARYADAAAHGGQVVTDTGLAAKILRQWHNTIGSSSSSGGGTAQVAPTAPIAATDPSGATQPDTNSNGITSGSFSGTVQHAAAGAAAAHGAQAGSSDTAAAANPASLGDAAAAAAAAPAPAPPSGANGGSGSGGSGGGSGLVDLGKLKLSRSVPADLGSAASDSSTAGMLLQLLKSPPPDIHLPRHSAHAAAADLAPAGPPATPKAAAVAEEPALAAVSEVPGAAGAVAAVLVECTWLGSFLFKGSPRPVEMVSFSPAVLQGRSYPSNAPSGKGVRVVQRVGLMDRVPVHLPGAVEGVWE